MNLSRSEAEKVWLISDTHFDHGNIIRYCNRPFRSVDQMNNVMLHNWNDTVGVNDLVFFLGDISFGRGSRYPQWWLKQLNGYIIFIAGSHDCQINRRSPTPNIVRISSAEYVSIDDLDFLLVHDPIDANGWNGWVIHGHKHAELPLIDCSTKRINVSVEAVSYIPISLAKVIDLIESHTSKQ